MTKKKKIRIGILIAVAVFLLTIITFIVVRLVAYNQTSVSLNFEHQGIISSLPIPKGSRPVAPFSVYGLKFKTFCSEEEVKTFYQKYFDSLPRVTMPGYFTEDSSKLYYDEQQHLIILEELHFMHEWDGLYFAVMYEPYGDGVGVRIVEEPKNAQ